MFIVLITNCYWRRLIASGKVNTRSNGCSQRSSNYVYTRFSYHSLCCVDGDGTLRADHRRGHDKRHHYRRQRRRSPVCRGHGQNTATQGERNLASNEAGIYVAQFLQPGAYEITVAKAGFAKTVRTGLTLQVGQSLTVNFSLAVQASTEAVTVAGDAEIVDTEKT